MKGPADSDGYGEMTEGEIRAALETQNRELIVQQKQLLAAADQLEALNERLKQADQMKSDFVSMVVHEIRNPLASVSQSIEVARDLGGEELPEKTRRYLDIAQRNVWRLNGILSDLLDLAKMEAGELEMSLDAVDPVEVITEAASFSQADADSAGVQLSVVGEGLPPVLADANRIVQVMGNFLSNAVKFTPKGGRITVEAAPSDKGALFSVVDTGPGIAREFQHIIFEKYRQLASWQGGGKRGTGLGLPICKNIVLLHGSMITVDSEPGRGARFSFELPRYSVAGKLKSIAPQILVRQPKAAWKLVFDAGRAWKAVLASVRRVTGDGEWQVIDVERGAVWVFSAVPEKTERRLLEASRSGHIPAPGPILRLAESVDAMGLLGIIEEDAKAAER